MKGTSPKPRLALIAACVWPLVAPSQIFTHEFEVDAAIPDDNSTGFADIRNVQQTGGVIGSLSLRLGLSAEPGFSAFLGDLYAYVEHDGKIAVLLNRPGRTAAAPFGYEDNQPLDIQFSDGGPDAHGYRPTEDTPLSAPLSGTFSPDGRAADPVSVLDSDERSLLLDQFNGLSPDGEWTLFVADLSGGGHHHLVQWSIELELAEIPEMPVWLTGGGLLAWRWWVRRQRDCPKRVSTVRMGP